MHGFTKTTRANNFLNTYLYIWMRSKRLLHIFSSKTSHIQLSFAVKRIVRVSKFLNQLISFGNSTLRYILLNVIMTA